MRSSMELGIRSKLNERESASTLGAITPFSITLLYRLANPRTTIKRSSMIDTPGTLRTTCAASLSWLFFICWFDTPFTICSPLRISINTDISVSVVFVDVTTTSLRLNELTFIVTFRATVFPASTSTLLLFISSYPTKRKTIVCVPASTGSS